MAEGTLRAILREAGISVSDFLKAWAATVFSFLATRHFL